MLVNLGFFKKISIQCGKTPPNNAVGGIHWVGRVKGNIDIFNFGPTQTYANFDFISQRSIFKIFNKDLFFLKI